MKYKHIFGPVLSRRLGISLGIDLVRHKICTLDCVYCECGKTTDLTITQKETVHFSDVKNELDHFLLNNDEPDYITFSGSGEPTLNPCIGKVISYIKEKSPGIKIAVLTNATLFDDPEVRAALLKADRVVPSLDAASIKAFNRINRPDSRLDLSKMISGIEQFSKEYSGELYLEIFILPGINDAPSDLLKLKTAINKIKPRKVQINTLDRPGTDPDLRPATKEELENVIEQLDYSPIEIIARVEEQPGSRVNRKDLQDAVLETIHRRPCTKQDLLQTLNMDKEQLDQMITRLEQQKKIIGTRQERGVFYQTIKKHNI